MARRASSENIVKLTKSTVAALSVEPGHSERVVWDTDMPGFGVRIRASGNKSWVIRPARSGGKSRLHTIGAVDALDVSLARQTARTKIAEVDLGGDPTKAKREARARAVVTLGSLVETYIADKIAQARRPSTIGNLRHHLEKHWRPLHARPLAEISRADVAVRHRAIEKENGPSAADRATSVLSTFFTWAIRDGLTETNPASNMRKAAVTEHKERALANEELASIWRACRDDQFGRIVKLLILTGLRKNEVAKMRWSEIDLQGAVWSIPAERMKNKRPHTVPLSGAALDILRSAPSRDGRDFIFGEGDGPFSGFSRAKRTLSERAGLAPDEWRIHDIRHTVSTGMNGVGIMPHIVEAVLSHVSGSRAGVAGRYNHATYLPEKREALDRWAAEVARICR
ncbi:tyrosine-type recombinase/integrase [Methylorubrum extorquens]